MQKRHFFVLYRQQKTEFPKKPSESDVAIAQCKYTFKMIFEYFLKYINTTFLFRVPSLDFDSTSLEIF